MTVNPNITESIVRSLATPQSFDRGKEYYRAGAVGDIERRGDTLRAEVEGSSYEPYQVTIELDEGGIASADCTCPYDWGGYCKHIVAVLLTYIRDQEAIEERPTAEALLAGVDGEMLRDVLSGLLASHPELMDQVESQLAIRRQQQAQVASPQAQPPLPQATAGAPRPRRTPIDTSAIRRQVRYQMRSSGDYYETSGTVSALDGILEQARQFVAGGDGENALAILAVIADETIPGWEEFDDSDGEFGDFFGRMGEVMTEAILTADLSQQEREEWSSKLLDWQGELDDYGVDEAFDAAIAAADQGWDDEVLHRALQGQAAEEGMWAEEPPEYAEDLTLARLRVLERQGRIEEYLNLAQATGQAEQYVTMLVKDGRSQEALDYGLKYLMVADEALSLAKALRESGQIPGALLIGERGLGLAGNRLALARWLRDFATAMKDDELALRAATVAFDASPLLADYQAVQAAAGAQWPTIRQELLQKLAQSQTVWDPVDIYLYEGMIDEAIKYVDARPYTGYATIEKVADAAFKTHPDWTIRQCKKQAEGIMDAGKSNAYSHAVRWLEKARRAYVVAGREHEWRAYCEGLIARHGRKHSLVPRLRELLKVATS